MEALELIFCQSKLLLAIERAILLVDWDILGVQAPTVSPESIRRACSLSLLRCLTSSCSIHSQSIKTWVKTYQDAIIDMEGMWDGQLAPHRFRFLADLLPLPSQTEIYLISLLRSLLLLTLQESPTIQLWVIYIIYPCFLIQFEALFKVIQNHFILFCKLLTLRALLFCYLRLSNAGFTDAAVRACRAAWTFGVRLNIIVPWPHLSV